jgi:hypothetical protein
MRIDSGDQVAKTHASLATFRFKDELVDSPPLKGDF